MSLFGKTILYGKSTLTSNFVNMQVNKLFSYIILLRYLFLNNPHILPCDFNHIRSPYTVVFDTCSWSSACCCHFVGDAWKATRMFSIVFADVKSHPAITAFSTAFVTKNFCIKRFTTSHLVDAFHREFEISVAPFLVICVSQPHNSMGLFLGRRHVFRYNSKTQL